jgi:hypothetical protein
MVTKVVRRAERDIIYAFRQDALNTLVSTDTVRPDTVRMTGELWKNSNTNSERPYDLQSLRERF